MAFLNKAQILAAEDLWIETVEVPEWGEGAQVGVRVMTGAELYAMNEKILALPDGKTFNQRAYVCALTLCDEEGGRLFSTEEMEALERKSSRALDRLYEVACRINVLRDSDRKLLEKKDAPVADGFGLPSHDSSVDAP